MIAEGDLFQISTGVDVSGLVGNISGAWQWGDGTTSPATLQTDIPTGNVSIRLDYSRDTSGFFSNSQRRALLQAAADSIVDRFGDQLSAVDPESPFVRWRPVIADPSTGNSVTLEANPTIQSGEIVIFAGARALTGPQVGEGGPGGIAFEVLPFSFSSQAERQQIEAQIEEDRQEIFGRGQAGALASPQTDVSLTHGSITFDTTEQNYHFGPASEIEPGEVDFFTIAAHELSHALGFGVALAGETSSWERLTANGSTFTGVNARAAYLGNGNVPIVPGHWATSVRDDVGQETALTASIFRGSTQSISALDFAALEDLGWEVLDVSASATGNHRFADDGTFAPTLILSGSGGGSRTLETDNVVVTNVAPTLSVADAQTVTVGQTLRITNAIEIEDPGFRNLQADPTTNETFTATIDWRDGTDIETVPVTIDRVGTAAGLTTLASIDATHTFETTGARTVRITVTDDDGGSAVGLLPVTVFAAPSISIAIDNDTFSEDAGVDAATLTISRTGPLDEPLNVSLSSNDDSEATVTSSVSFAVNQAEITVGIRAIDDQLLDETQSVTFTASATGVASQTVTASVDDAEQIFGRAEDVVVVESNATGVVIPIIRTNTDTTQPISFTITGGNTNRATVSGEMEIAANTRSRAIRFTPVDNTSGASSPLRLTYTVIADGYQPSTFVINILDDERPVFQNQTDRFNTDSEGGVSPIDALLVINFIRRNGSGDVLNPISDPPQTNALVDVNGDYRVTPVDALEVINELRRRRGSGEGESLSVEPSIDNGTAVDAVIAQIESERRHPWHLESSDDWLPVDGSLLG